MSDESRRGLGRPRRRDGRAAPDPARPVEAASRGRGSGRSASTIKRRPVRRRHLHLRPAADPRLPRRRPSEISRVEPVFLVGGVRSAVRRLVRLLAAHPLGARRARPAGSSRWRMFRIQMSTKALSNIVPGGSAAGSALGYRLLTLSGVSGPDAGFALATAGLGSAVVLNLLFWTAPARVDPVPRRQPAVRHRGPARRSAIMVVVAVLVLGLQHGQGRAERFLGWLGRKLRFDPDTATDAPAPDRRAPRGPHRRPGAAQAGRAVGQPQLAARRRVAVGVPAGLRRDARRSTPCSSRSGWPTSSPSSRSRPAVSASSRASYIPTLVGFGLTRREATLGVASYRLAQLWLPILLGGLFYASLRVGPWSIERRDRLDRLRDIARRETSESERRIEFALRQWERRRPGVPIPVDEDGNVVLPFDVMPGVLDADRRRRRRAGRRRRVPGPDHRDRRPGRPADAPATPVGTGDTGR